MYPKVEYLGHNISQDDIRPALEKVRAIKDAPKPANVTQLKSFLGLVNYYCKFFANLSTTLAPPLQPPAETDKLVLRPS